MYIETSSPQKPGDKARLISPEYKVAAGGSCLQFFYHMWGASTGALNVYLKVGQTLEGRPLWALSGDQGDFWRPARATIRTNSKYQVNTIHKQELLTSTKNFLFLSLGRFRRCSWSKLYRRYFHR